MRRPPGPIGPSPVWPVASRRRYRSTSAAGIGQAQRAAQLDDGLAEHVRVADTLTAGDERAVDLELVDLERVQVAERRVAGAEVVDRQPKPERAQLADALDGLEPRRQQRALGDLEGEIRRVHARPGEGRDDHRHEPRITELARRQVDVQAQVGQVETGLPRAPATTAFADHPAPDWQDLPGLL